jgi:hypothetical protein
MANSPRIQDKVSADILAKKCSDGPYVTSQTSNKKFKQKMLSSSASEQRYHFQHQVRGCPGLVTGPRRWGRAQPSQCAS